MSRENEYRAWDKNAEYMLGPATIQYLVAQSMSTLDEGYYVENYEFMQYTGVKDKNGVKIFEGDIIIRKYESGEITIGVVRWDYYSDGEYVLNVECWMAGGWPISDLGGLYGVSRHTNEVIGNDYQDSHLLNENPELLERNQ